MRTFMIAYDLAQPSQNRHQLADAIMSLGIAWARPLEQIWYVRAPAAEADLLQKLATVLDTDDGLIVQPVTDTGMLSNTHLRWFKQRGADGAMLTTSDAADNVVVFPRQDPVETDRVAAPLAVAS